MNILPLKYLILLLCGVIVFMTLQRNFIWKDELSLWNDVVKKSYRKPRGYYNLGNTYWRTGSIDAAIKQYEIAIRLNPFYPDPHYNLAIAYRSRGLVHQAIQQYKITIDLKPDFIEAYFNLGILYIENGFIEEAYNEFKTVLKISPNHEQSQQFLKYISELQLKQ